MESRTKLIQPTRFLEIPFANERLATIAQRVMDVDTELRETQVLRIITAEKNILKV